MQSTVAVLFNRLRPDCIKVSALNELAAQQIAGADADNQSSFRWRHLRRGSAQSLGGDEPMSSIIAIHPYMTEGIWVFDDAAVGLREEPFISGADTIIERMVADIPGAKDGFTLLFSADPFPGYQLELEWVRGEMSGNWYRSQALGMEGWLCPALLKYFESPPVKLYTQFRGRSPNKTMEPTR